MDWINLVLNLAVLLLWISWRASTDSLPRLRPGSSILTTIRRTGDAGYEGWFHLASMIAILAARAVFYWQVGPAVRWTARLNLLVVTIPFRSDFLDRMALYSALSFLCWLGGLYAWLILISAVNRSVPDGNPWQRLVRQQLGRLDRIPWPVKLVLPWLVAAAGWLGAAELFRQTGLLPEPLATGRLWQQAALFGLSVYLLWEYAVVLILLLYTINSYVYFGSHPIWEFTQATGTNLLRPLGRIRLRFGKVDFTPLLVMGLAIGVGETVRNWLPDIYHRLPIR